MKRRLNIGIGLLHEPTLLILDEPTVGVDPQSRNAILDSVEQLAGRGMAVLYTTHYMEEAERLCDRIGILDEGRLVAEGTRRELLALVSDRDQVRIEVAGDAAAVARACATLPAVDARVDGAGVVCSVDGAAGMLADLLGAATRTGTAVTSVEVRGADLETVFLHLTGKALRD
jgi:ABC-2 type transport system ATP-binding protein